MIKKTYNAGADVERSTWLRKLRALRRRYRRAGILERALIDQLIAWGKGRATRTAAKKGGLGRK